jgi:thioredoxin 1
MITHADDSSFAHFVGAASQGIPVLVDFHALWCGPCKAIAPMLEQLDQQLRGRVQIVKVDIDTATHTAMALAIKSIPTLVLYKQGRIVGRYTGNPGSLGAILKFFGPELGL